MFSRSSTTITPFRISHSTARLLSFLIRNVDLPSGAETAPGSQPASVSVIRIASGATGAALAWPSAWLAKISVGRHSAANLPCRERARALWALDMGFPPVLRRGPSSGTRQRRAAARRPEKRQHGQQEREIDDHLADRRRFLIAEHAGQQRSDNAVLR